MTALVDQCPHVEHDDDFMNTVIGPIAGQLCQWTAYASGAVVHTVDGPHEDVDCDALINEIVKMVEAIPQPPDPTTLPDGGTTSRPQPLGVDIRVAASVGQLGGKRLAYAAITEMWSVTDPATGETQDYERILCAAAGSQVYGMWACVRPLANLPPEPVKPRWSEINVVFDQERLAPDSPLPLAAMPIFGQYLSRFGISTDLGLLPAVLQAALQHATCKEPFAVLIGAGEYDTAAIRVILGLALNLKCQLWIYDMTAGWIAWEPNITATDPAQLESEVLILSPATVLMVSGFDTSPY